jgi:hypothetical protein
MTEAEWLTCSNAATMLRVLCRQFKVAQNETGQRKLRLFCCALARRVWFTLEDERSRVAVDVSERFADGLATKSDLQIALRTAQAVEWPLQIAEMLRLSREGPTAENQAARALLYTANVRRSGGSLAWETAHRRHTQVTVSHVMDDVRNIQKEGIDLKDHAMIRKANDTEWTLQSTLLREVFGNPFQPVTFDSSWRSCTGASLAQAIYDERAFDRMPILADALEDSGCTNQDILAHCRGPEPHVRGCWVVDLLIRKE